MVELYCYMCSHVWNDTTKDRCPECGCKDFMVNDIGFEDDGHYEGDFERPLTVSDDHGE